jgi:hypothetical protein
MSQKNINSTYSASQIEFIEQAYSQAGCFFDFHQAFTTAPFWIGEDQIEELWDHMSSFNY